MLELKNIVKTYQAGDTTVTALNGVSLSFRESEFVSILGHSGCGKTTLFNVLSGIYSPDKGKVYLNSQDITGKPGKVSYMLQKDLLFRPILICRKNLNHLSCTRIHRIRKLLPYL